MKEWVGVVVHGVFAYFLMTVVMLAIYLIAS